LASGFVPICLLTASGSPIPRVAIGAYQAPVSLRLPRHLNTQS
jgi:hypothetical protein